MPLFQGRSLEAYDHRFAGVDFNPHNIRRGFVSLQTSLSEHQDPNFRIKYQYFVPESAVRAVLKHEYLFAYRRSTATTNARTMVSSIVPRQGFGDSVFLLVPEQPQPECALSLCLLQGNVMSVPFDFIARNKLQGQNFSWYILEQLPVVPSESYGMVKFGKKTAGELVREAVLELTYTAHDMAAFAKDMGYVDKKGEVLPPFAWDEERRLKLRAKLDAIYFHLYGITDRDDVRYIYSTFPIVEREETAAYGSYRSRELCLAWMNALKAGDPDAKIDL